MFKLIINNLQVGNYKTYKEMITSLVTVYCAGKVCKSMKHDGKKLYVRFYEED